MERPDELRTVLPLLVLIVLVAFCGIFGRDLWTPDEPRVTAICMKMAEDGDLVVPHLGGQPFLEKPPLGFIVGAGFVKVFGGFMTPVAAIRWGSVFWSLGVMALSWLLVRRISSEQRLAWQTVMVLGSSWGFTESQHWIRVDPALCFFVAAAAWALVEAFVRNRAWWVVAGGAFTGGAFLVKGLIGPVMVFPVWLALVVAFGWPAVKNRRVEIPMVIGHLLGSLACLLISSSWVFLLWLRGDPEFFHHWFLENQVGRATGTSVELGHIHVGEPWYYLSYLVILMIPWSPFVIGWLWKSLGKICKRQELERTSIFVLAWGMGSLILLSIPATKRSLYLLPALPAFAIMAAMGWEEAGDRWKNLHLNLWQWFCAIFLILLAFSPLWAGTISGKLNPSASELVSGWGTLQLVVLVLAVLTALLIRSRGWNSFEKMVGLTALLFLAIWIFPGRVVDRQKSFQGPVRAFVDSVPAGVWDQTKGWALSETMRGFLYVYEGIEIPNCTDIREAKTVLDGQDPDYRYLVLTPRATIKLPEGLRWKLVTQGEESKRRLKLITGEECLLPLESR